MDKDFAGNLRYEMALIAVIFQNGSEPGNNLR